MEETGSLQGIQYHPVVSPQFFTNYKSLILSKCKLFSDTCEHTLEELEGSDCISFIEAILNQLSMSLFRDHPDSDGGN